MTSAPHLPANGYDTTEWKLRLRARDTAAKAAFSEGITLPGCALALSVFAIGFSTDNVAIQVVMTAGAIVLLGVLFGAYLRSQPRGAAAVAAEMDLRTHLAGLQTTPQPNVAAAAPLISTAQALLPG